MHELVTLVDRGAKEEGINDTLFPGLRLHRASRNSAFRKWTSLGPSLTVVAQGRKVATHRGVKLAYDDRRYLVVTGEAHFEGMVLDASPQRPGLSVCFQIPPDAVAKALLTLSSSPPATPVKEAVPAFVGAIDVGIAESVVRMLRALPDEAERAVVIPLAIEELVFRLLRTDAAAALRGAVHLERDAEKIQHAMRFMRANLAQSVTVEDVARQVAMSPSHFAHRFRAVARVSPMRYLKGLRIAHARTLLLNDGVRVSEAALQSGYESASHFTRDFKQVHGASPADYLRRFRQSQD